MEQYKVNSIIYIIFLIVLAFIFFGIPLIILKFIEFDLSNPKIYKIIIAFLKIIVAILVSSIIIVWIFI
tara:strand:+ start:795 stop:1001 length:207 start_codon:yes stop_codon:yes gene_type:complete